MTWLPAGTKGGVGDVSVLSFDVPVILHVVFSSAIFFTDDAFLYLFIIHIKKLFGSRAPFVICHGQSRRLISEFTARAEPGL